MLKPRTLLVTGKTEHQLVDEMKMLEFAEEQGIKTPSIRTCYLCKREEGENSLLIYEDNIEKIILNPIELSPCEIEFGGGVTYSYLLCIECALLLDIMDKMEPELAE